MSLNFTGISYTKHSYDNMHHGRTYLYEDGTFFETHEENLETESSTNSDSATYQSGASNVNNHNNTEITTRTNNNSWIDKRTLF